MTNLKLTFTFTCFLLLPLTATATATAFAFAPSSSSFIGRSTTSTLSVQATSPSTLTSSSQTQLASSTQNGSNSNAGFYTDDEWHPHDPAETTPQLLSSIWCQISNGISMVKGETSTVMYPRMQEDLVQPRYLNLLMAHLDCCKDVCDNFGITMTVTPYQKDGKVAGMTVRSFRNPEKSKEDDYDFAYDPFWDDGTDFENLYEGIDDEDAEKDPYPEIENKVPDDDDLMISITKKWVGRMMSDMGICPFSQNAESAGLPVGQVFYCVDRSTSMEDMYNRYWNEVVRVEQNKEKDLSTTLLIAPEFCLDNLEMFESFTNTLTQPLTALGVETLLQLVFFHPHWSFRDGDARSGSGQAANYARRSPWPMINILRTSQVRAAQKGIPTGLVYKQNEKTLASIGVDKLETMLRLRDWEDMEEIKVNRKDIDALKIAQDYQKTGSLKKEDTSMAHDNTPAANKVDPRQVEGGNLVNVLTQALEKRLGVSGAMAVLSGPETSATAMAVDYLLNELDDIADGKVTAVAEEPQVDTSLNTPEGRRAARVEAARRAMLEDWGEDEEASDSGNRGFGDPMSDVLFGRGGIPDKEVDNAEVSDDFDATRF